MYVCATLFFNFLFHLSLSASGKSTMEQENWLKEPNALTPLLNKNKQQTKKKNHMI